VGVLTTALQTLRRFGGGERSGRAFDCRIGDESGCAERTPSTLTFEEAVMSTSSRVKAHVRALPNAAIAIALDSPRRDSRPSAPAVPRWVLGSMPWVVMAAAACGGSSNGGAMVETDGGAEYDAKGMMPADGGSSHDTGAPNSGGHDAAADVMADALVISHEAGSPHDSGSPHDGGAPADTGSPQDSGGPDGAAKDASIPDAEVDAGGPNPTFPAFPVDTATIVNNGGAVLSAPQIVTVVWSSDPDYKTYLAMDDAIGASTYWSTLNSEYKVGPATSGASNHVVLATAAPASMSDADLDTFVDDNAGKNGWPASTANTIYAIFMDPTTDLLLTGAGADGGFGSACDQGIGGYHTETATNGYVYAIMPHCSSFQVSDVEESASHELNEASTDPYPGGNTAWAGFDANHLSYEFLNAFQDEVGDACESFASSYYQDTEPSFDYWVQRQWSNKSAQAGHNPCVPVLGQPYYNVTLVPSQETTINVDLTSVFGPGIGMMQSKGFKGALNKALTFDVELFSDATTVGVSTDAGPSDGKWTVTANVPPQLYVTDQSGNAINNGAAKISLSSSTGWNGDVIHVTLTPTAWSSIGAIYVEFASSLPGSRPSHVQPMIVSAN
jgi:hypothetical protein